MPSESHRWLVLAEGERRRWGGDLRRAFIFAPFAERTGATIARGWSSASVRSGLDEAAGPRRGVLLRRGRPYVVTAETLTPDSVAEVCRRGRPFALDVHDDPVAQLEAFGMAVEPDRRAALRARKQANLEAFEWQVAPSESFAELAGIRPERLIVAPNGTDSAHVRPGPLPARPTIGFVSGATEGRGIELLVAAARDVREIVPDLELRLWLVASGDTGEAYLHGLQADLAADPWVIIGAAPYERLGEHLAGATVMCVPHPANPYLDSALPVKLFDSMAAGRPVVVTPRLETRRVVERTRAGLVAAGDRAEDLATALRVVLLDPVLAAELGANGRAAAELEYDWRTIGDRLSDELLARAGP